MEEVYHIFSNGELTPDLFTSVADFKRANNQIAVIAHLAGVIVLGYSLEDTHLHILAKGNVDNCTYFKKELQRLIRRWRQMDIVIDMEEVTNNDYLMRVGTYVICQATKDGKQILPTDYKWSSAPLYFRQGDADLLWTIDEDRMIKDIVKMRDIPLRKQRAVFHTRSRLPDEWMVCDNLILPSSFVDIAGFEAIYKTHNCFRAFCGSGKKSDEIVMSSMSKKTGVRMLETEARNLARQTCFRMFGRIDARWLNLDQRIQLGRELRRQYRMSIPQIARRIYLKEADVRKVIK